MKRLSIIIPHYNTPKLLQRLLESIPNIPEIEILVIDDNSDLGILDYVQCKKANSNRNIFFFQNPLSQRGAGNARNIGIKHAKGEWLLFADADDFFVLGFWDVVRSYLDDTADLIYFLSTSRYLNSAKKSERHVPYKQLVMNYYEEPNHVNEIKLRYAYLPPWAKMVRRNIVEKYKIYFDGTKYSNDIMFSCKIGYFSDKIKAINKTIYCITESEGSLTAVKDKEASKIRGRVYCNYYFFLCKILSRKDMKIFGYGMKEYLYFCKYRIKIYFNID